MKLRRSKLSKSIVMLFALATVFTLSGGQKKSETLPVSFSYSRSIDTLRKENDRKLKLLIDKTIKQYADKKSKNAL